MKKFLPILLLFLAVVSCKVQKVDPVYHSYSDDISFKVKNIVNTKILDKSDAGYSRTQIAGSGTAYKQVQFHVKNDSANDDEVNFENIILLDSKGNHYKATMCVRSGRLSVTYEKFNHKIKAGKSSTFVLNFEPAFPKDENVAKIMVKNKIVIL